MKPTWLDFSERLKEEEKEVSITIIDQWNRLLYSLDSDIVKEFISEWCNTVELIISQERFANIKTSKNIFEVQTKLKRLLDNH